MKRRKGIQTSRSHRVPNPPYHAVWAGCGQAVEYSRTRDKVVRRCNLMIAVMIGGRGEEWRGGAGRMGVALVSDPAARRPTPHPRPRLATRSCRSLTKLAKTLTILREVGVEHCRRGYTSPIEAETASRPRRLNAPSPSSHIRLCSRHSPSLTLFLVAHHA